MKVLFISERLLWHDTGAEVVTKNNLRSLYDIFGKNNVDIITFNEKESNLCKLDVSDNLTLLKKYDNKILKFINWIFLNNGGLNTKTNTQLYNHIKVNKYDYIFLDSSVYGKIAKKIKKYNSDIKIITFFHDVSKFWSKSLISSCKEFKGKIRLCTYHSSYVYNEKLAIQYSDRIIALNNRDADLIESEYKKKVDSIIPVSLKDNFDKERVIKKTNNKKIELLFVGAYYLPNVTGIKWFIKNVLPYIDVELTVVGKGMDLLKQEIDDEKVKIKGFVEDLGEYYYNADLVIAPIFEGGGMKVKIAEALMYGKSIIGTSEAFEGYDFEVSNVGAECNSEKDFIESINNYITSQNKSKFNNYSRKEYEEKYEYNNCLLRMIEVFR